MKRCFTVSAHLFGLASVTFLCLSPAMGQSAYFSLEGDFNVAADQHDFFLDLSRIVGSTEDLRFVTYTHAGGTNAAGDVIAASGFDSDLRLFDSLNGLRGQDDQSGPGFDALLSWGTVQVFGTALNPDPLLADSYRLNLREFFTLTGPWAVDLIGPADAISFTGATPTGSSTIDSLKFGTTGGGTAVFNSSGTLTLGDLVVAPSGGATLNLSGGTITVGGLSTVNAGGTLNISLAGGGTFNANGNVDVDGGTITRGSASNSFNLASGLTLTATNNAQINFGGFYVIDQSTTFDIQSGADFSTTSFLDIGTVSDGTLVVDGAGSSVTTGATNSFWSLNGNTADVTFRNGATGNLGEIDLAQSSTAGTTSNFNVESGATVTTDSLFVGINGGATTSGTITVDGGTSSLTQNGSSLLTVGHATEGTATINVQNGGTFNTGTGTTTVNATGTINVGVVGGGTFNANGNVNVNGGTITRGSASNSFNLASGLTLTATNDAQINFAGTYDIDLGTTFDIQSGADFSTTGFLDIGDGGDGTLLVDGVGSSVTFGATNSFWGVLGNTADVTFRNGATGNLGEIRLALTSTAGTTGIFNVESGATVTTDSLRIAILGGATTFGTITVDGGTSSLTQNGTSVLFVGHATSGTATINVQNFGTFNTGTGTTLVNATGTINVGVFGSGTFNANGNVNVDGGTINRVLSNSFNLASGLTLTATNDAQINFGGTYDIDQSTTFDIQSGADFSTTSYLDIGVSSGDGTLLVDGVGSSVTTGTALSFWGFGGNTADVTFRNGATGNLGGISLARSSTGGTTGIFRVESGATVTTGNLNIAEFGGATTSGTITVDGGTSSLTQNGSSTLTVGHSSTGTATINVQNGGTFTTGTGATTLDATGVLNLLSGGTFNVNGNMTIVGGTINLNGGTLSLPDEDPLTGSTGTFNFTGGVLELRDAITLSQPILDTTLGGSTIGAGRELRTLGVTTLPASISLDVGGGTLDTAGLVMLPGSSLLALVPSTVTTGTLLASAATTINATGSDMTLGDASAVNGFASAGTTHVGNSTVTLLDTNDAVFDSLALVTLGDGLGGAGTLGAANGLSLDLGGNITGFGTVDTPDNAATPLINNGNITGNDPNAPITLAGYVKGVGTLDNVNITGTDAPGFSTAAVNRGSVSYNGTVEIEIGGTAPGSGYDQLNHILGAGIAELGGTLDVLLIGGFVPSLGDTFDILTAIGGVSGTFASTLLPDLGLLAMDLSYDTNTVTLAVVPALPGDFDIDGDVDGFDFLGWQRGESPNPLSQSDLADWEANYGAVASPITAASTSVPEPSSSTLLLTSLLCMTFRRRS